MKTNYKIILVTLTLLVLGTFYFIKYTTRKIGSDKILFYNPFTIDENGFNKNYDKATELLKKGDTVSAKKYFAQAINYRGTHNEEVWEDIYTCGNGLWEYKQDKLLKFSNCFEQLGMLDSAMSCLEPALYNFEKYHYPTDEQFFRLAIKKYGKDEVIEELKVGIANIQKIDCFKCTDYYFQFKGFKIGIYEFSLNVDKNTLFEKFKIKYCG
jgi:hypothetical protein